MKTDYCYYTPLFWAVRKKNCAMAQLLLDYGASIEATQHEGKTVLHIAVTNGDEDMVKLLLDRGANREAPDSINKKPLDIAASKSMRDLLRNYPKGAQ